MCGANGSPRRRRSSGLLRAGGLVLAGAIGLSGCQGTPVSRDYDPLVGGSPIPAAPAGRLPSENSRPVEGVAKNSDPLLLPPSQASSSPAALAVATPPPAPDRRTPAGEVNLQAPRPADARLAVADPGSPPVVTPAGAVAPAGGDSYERLQKQLLSRGVVWQQLKNVERDEWHYICAIPDPQQPNVRRNYEARASGPMGLAAMRAVIDEIDRDRY